MTMPSAARPHKRGLRARLNETWLRLKVALGDADSLPRSQVLLLRLTLLADGLVAIALAIFELELVSTIMSALGVALLLAVAAANLYAVYSLRRGRPSWPRNVAIAQGSVAVLATYVVFTAVRSYAQNWWTVSIAAGVGLFAIAWVLRVGHGAVSVPWTKSAAIVAAVIPLAGLVQFWLQSEYIPNLTFPMVDVSAELSPVGRTGSTIHLSAKLTFHNRGSFVVMNPAGLMRVTAYPTNTQRTVSPCSTEGPFQTYDAAGDAHYFSTNLVQAMDPNNTEPDAEFRYEATPVGQCGLLYANFIGGPSAFLHPGGTSTVQKDIDVDANSIRLVRLSGSAVFFTQRRLKDVRACWPDKDTAKLLNPSHWPMRASLYNDDIVPFINEVQHVWPRPDLSEGLCIDYELAPRSVIQQIVSGPPVLRVEVVMGRWWDYFNEYPQIVWAIGSVADIGKSQSQDEVDKIQQANPVSSITDVSAEYAPSDPPPPWSPESGFAKAAG
jgi:hypothetical protein